MIAILISSLSIYVYAEEDNFLNTLNNQTNANNAGQLYVNEPLDNAVPVIYKYEIEPVNESENEKETEEGGYIVPGEEFILKFTVYNPAVVSKIGNIRIVLAQEEGLIYPEYGRTNSVYIGYLEPLAYAEGKMRLTASKDITAEKVNVVLQMSYTDNFYTNNSSQLIATLPVSSSGKINISNVDIPSNMYVGANNRFSISCQNNGLSNVNNVILHMAGEKIDDQEIALGNIASGSSTTSDIYLVLKEAGAQTLSMYFTYSDTDGRMKQTESQEYNIVVSNYEDTEVTDDYDENRNLMNKYFTFGILFICVAVVAGYVYSVVKKVMLEKDLVKDKKL